LYSVQRLAGTEASVEAAEQEEEEVLLVDDDAAAVGAVLFLPEEVPLEVELLLWP
jgi:hypothetical protein